MNNRFSVARCCCGDPVCAAPSSIDISSPVLAQKYEVGPADSSWTTFTMEVSHDVLSTSSLDIQSDLFWPNSSLQAAYHSKSKSAFAGSRTSWKSTTADNYSTTAFTPSLGVLTLKTVGTRIGGSTDTTAMEWKFYEDGVLTKTHTATNTGDFINAVSGWCPMGVSVGGFNNFDLKASFT